MSGNYAVWRATLFGFNLPFYRYATRNGGKGFSRTRDGATFKAIVSLERDQEQA